jgi:anti-sigma regulatory factor (Ser/Thr protein kinase)
LFVRVARVAASALAALLGLTLDRVREIEQAVGEVCHCLIARAPGRAPVVALRFLVDDEKLTVEIRIDGCDVGVSDLGAFVEQPEVGTLLAYLCQLVDAIAIQWDSQSGLSVTLVKHRYVEQEPSAR